MTKTVTALDPNKAYTRAQLEELVAARSKTAINQYLRAAYASGILKGHGDDDNPGSPDNHPGFLPHIIRPGYTGQFRVRLREAELIDYTIKAYEACDVAVEEAAEEKKAAPKKEKPAAKAKDEKPSEDKRGLGTDAASILEELRALRADLPRPDDSLIDAIDETVGRHVSQVLKGQEGLQEGQRKLGRGQARIAGGLAHLSGALLAEEESQELRDILSMDLDDVPDKLGDFDPLG